MIVFEAAGEANIHDRMVPAPETVERDRSVAEAFDQLVEELEETVSPELKEQLEKVTAGWKPNAGPDDDDQMKLIGE